VSALVQLRGKLIASLIWLLSLIVFLDYLVRGAKWSSWGFPVGLTYLGLLFWKHRK
jgi:hypothetical protein